MFSVLVYLTFVHGAFCPGVWYCPLLLSHMSKQVYIVFCLLFFMLFDGTAQWEHVNYCVLVTTVYIQVCEMNLSWIPCITEYSSVWDEFVLNTLYYRIFKCMRGVSWIPCITEYSSVWEVCPEYLVLQCIQAVFRIGVDSFSNCRLDPDPYSIYGSGSSKGYWAIKNPIFMLIFHDFHLISKNYTIKTYLVKYNTYFSGWKQISHKIFVIAFEKMSFFLPGSGSVLKSNLDPEQNRGKNLDPDP